MQTGTAREQTTNLLIRCPTLPPEPASATHSKKMMLEISMTDPLLEILFYSIFFF